MITVGLFWICTIMFYVFILWFFSNLILSFFEAIEEVFDLVCDIGAFVVPIALIVGGVVIAILYGTGVIDLGQLGVAIVAVISVIVGIVLLFIAGVFLSDYFGIDIGDIYLAIEDAMENIAGFAEGIFESLLEFVDRKVNKD